MGWLLVLFDMPVTTAEERKAATKFRNTLLDCGYLMLQFSAYARCAVTLEKRQGLINELRKATPESGTIQCLYMTDAQWAGIITLHQGKKSDKDVKKQVQIGEQLQFW